MRSGFRLVFLASRCCLLVPLLLFPGCQAPAEAPAEAGTAAPVEPSPQAPDPLALAHAALLEGDTNRALNRLDDARTEHRDDPSFWLLYGDTLLRFAAEELAGGRPHAGVLEGCYADADAAYARATQLAPADWRPLAGSARARRAAGDAEGAWEAAAACLAIGADLPAAAALELGRAGLALTIARVQAGAGVPGAARQAETLLAGAAAAGEAEAALLLSDLLAWENLREDARRVLVERLGVAPRDGAAIERLKNLAAGAAATLVLDLEQVRRQQPGDAFLLWYLGEARYHEHLAAVAGGDFLSAYEAIDRAEECFLQALAIDAGVAESCAQWLHLVRSARGWALWQEGRVDDAGQAFLAALEAAPARLEAEPTAGSLRLGVEAVMGHYFARERDLVKARAFLRRATAAHDGEATWWNNLGLACRDLAEPRARAAGGELSDELRALFEEAWAAYSRAVELAPQDANILNDHALIAVYYLDHDLAEAEAELHRAIAAGTAALAEVDRAADPATWQRLDMAVGDAWENLAYLDLMRRQRSDRAAGYLDESSRHFPFQDRDGVRMLREVLGRLPAGAGADGEETEAGGTDN